MPDSKAKDKEAEGAGAKVTPPREQRKLMLVLPKSAKDEEMITGTISLGNDSIEMPDAEAQRAGFELVAQQAHLLRGQFPQYVYKQEKLKDKGGK